MGADIELFCSLCALCHTTKDSTQKPVGLLHSLPIPNRPWQSVGLDFMGPLPKSKGYDYLLVVIDRFTSQVHLLPTTTCATAKAVAWLFFTEIVRLHGMLESIVSDRDPNFTSKFWKELHRLVGTKLLMSTSFHPQMDGAMEWANRSISQVLQALVHNSQNNWAEHCPMVEFTLNSSVSVSMGYTPFELNYGYIPQLGQRLNTNTKFVGVCQFAEQALWNVTAWRVHPTFHMSLLRAHVPNNNVRFPHRDTKACYDFGAANKPEWFVDEILAHCWVDSTGLELQVHWTLGNATWEPLASCKELAALDEYLELHGVK